MKKITKLLALTLSFAFLIGVMAVSSSALWLGVYKTASGDKSYPYSYTGDNDPEEGAGNELRATSREIKLKSYIKLVYRYGNSGTYMRAYETKLVENTTGLDQTLLRSVTKNGADLNLIGFRATSDFYPNGIQERTFCPSTDMDMYQSFVKAYDTFNINILGTVVDE